MGKCGPGEPGPYRRRAWSRVGRQSGAEGDYGHEAAGLVAFFAVAEEVGGWQAVQRSLTGCFGGGGRAKEL